jgi:hypothetical protein
MLSYHAYNSAPPNRFLSALIVTGLIMALLSLAYVLIVKRDRVFEVVRTPKAALVFRYALGGTAVVVLLASLFPRESPEMGVLLYFILWPLLGLQLGATFLPWQRLAISHPAVALGLAIAAGVYAFFVDSLMLQLASYIG